MRSISDNHLLWEWAAGRSFGGLFYPTNSKIIPLSNIGGKCGADGCQVVYIDVWNTK